MRWRRPDAKPLEIFLPQNDVAQSFSSLKHSDVPESRFIQDHHAVHRQTRSIDNVSSTLVILLKQAS